MTLNVATGHCKVTEKPSSPAAILLRHLKLKKN